MKIIWMIVCLTAVFGWYAQANNQVTIKPGIRYQIWEGFGQGGMDQHIPDWYVKWPASQKTAFLDRMYTLKDQGLGLEICRICMPVGDKPGHNHHHRFDSQDKFPPASFEPEDGVFVWDGHDNIMWHILGASERGARMWASWYSVPYWMTVSSCSGGSLDGNSNNLRADMEARLASHICRVVSHFRDSCKVNFAYIGAINEPDETWWKGWDGVSNIQNTGGQPGCRVTSSQAITIYQELIAQMAKDNITAQLTGPDSFSIGKDHNLKYAQAMLNSTVGPSLDILTCHQYEVKGDGPAWWYKMAQKYKKSLWMSEWGDWGLARQKDNETQLQQAMKYAGHIQQAIKDLHANAWIAWEAGFLLNHDDSGFTLRKSYWAVAQFSRHIRSGMQLIDSKDSNSECQTCVWVDKTGDSPVKKLVCVTVHSGKKEFQVKYNLSGFGNVKINEARRTSLTEDYFSTTIETIGPSVFSISAPSQSVITIEATITP